MLPGLRFLCAAAVLSVSLLVFGFGATALLRSAHQDVARLPILRAPPETVFAQPEPQPRLAMFRVKPAVQDLETPAVVADPAPAVIDPKPSVIPTVTEPDGTAAPEKLAAVSPVPEPAVVAAAPVQPQPVPEVLPGTGQLDVPAAAEVAKLDATPELTPIIAAPNPPAVAEPPAVTVSAAAPANAPVESVLPAIQTSPTEPSQVATAIVTREEPLVAVAPVVAAKPVAIATKPKKTARKRTIKRKRVAARAVEAEAPQAANPFAPQPFR
ncbi:hypothetical protein BH11PSE4_BH11PSE4_05670 [soil metagenome]